MTQPREILPGRTYLITRRCTQRQFLLRPDEETKEVFAYCLAEAAKRHNIALIAWLAMSNHYHAVVHAPEANLPAFLEQLHKMLAKVLNARWGRWENLWSSEETCVTYLPTPADVFDKVVYTLANPVVAGLVDQAIHWPGCSSLKQNHGGKPSRHKRPASFFSPTRSRMPLEVELCAVPPPNLASGETHRQWLARVHAAVEQQERAARSERLRQQKGVFGRKAVIAASPVASPDTSERHRKLRPALACMERERRVHEIEKLKLFRAEYTRARRLWISGNPNTEFPSGTYRLRGFGANCAPFAQAA